MLRGSHSSMCLDRFGNFACSVPVSPQPCICARRSNGLLREPLVKVKQPGRRVPTRSFLVTVASASFLPCVTRVWLCLQLSQDPQFLPVGGGERHAALAWTGCRRQHVRSRREHRFNTFFDRETLRACATRLLLPILAVNGHALPLPQAAPLERLLRCEHRVSVRTTHGRSALLAYPHPTGGRPLKRSALVGSGGTSPPISVCPSTLLLPHRLL
jgi:hypothetical protein